jgi:hypothetical protein
MKIKHVGCLLHTETFCLILRDKLSLCLLLGLV